MPVDREALRELLTRCQDGPEQALLDRRHLSMLSDTTQEATGLSGLYIWGIRAGGETIYRHSGPMAAEMLLCATILQAVRAGVDEDDPDRRLLDMMVDGLRMILGITPIEQINAPLPTPQVN